MAIKYRIVERQNALTKTLQYYAQVEPVEPLTLQDIVEGIEKTSTVSSADIKAVLDALQFEVIRALKGGQSVRLGDLGSFRPTLTSRSALSAEAFTRDNLKGVRVQFTPSGRMRTELALDRVSVRLVTSGTTLGISGTTLVFPGYTPRSPRTVNYQLSIINSRNAAHTEPETPVRRAGRAARPLRGARRADIRRA